MTEYKRLTDKTKNEALVDCYDCPYCGVEYLYDCHIKVCNHLAELEDKIENGTLMELPCKVGDTLYYVNAFSPTPRIEENIVHTIEMFNARDGFNIRIWTQNGTFYANNMPNVFKTKGQAEQRLKELKND